VLLQTRRLQVAPGLATAQDLVAELAAFQVKVPAAADAALDWR